MKLELQSAANFLVHLVRLGRRNISELQLEKFRQCLQEVLRRRYRDHWFPEKPFKGSGYRCIRINGKMDPVIAQAAESCQLSPSLLHQTFPSERTMWIDPLEVSYRIGENGSICVLYEYLEGRVNEPWKPASTSLQTPSSTTANNNKNVQQQQQQQKEPTTKTTTTTTSENDNGSCKESLRYVDSLLDPRKSVSIDQLTAFVSS
jgi:protein Tob/BTG